MIKSLNSASVEKPVRPIEILQFGEGNFLRAFVDYWFDVSNELIHQNVLEAEVLL